VQLRAAPGIPHAITPLATALRAAFPIARAQRIGNATPPARRPAHRVPIAGIAGPLGDAQEIAQPGRPTRRAASAPAWHAA
jgi:hypothetical protein